MTSWKRTASRPRRGMASSSSRPSAMPSLSSLSVSTKSHYNDVIMSVMASEITSITNFYSTVYSGTYERKHQSSASPAFVVGIHRWPVNSPHKGPVTRKMFPFDDVIMPRLKGGHVDEFFITGCAGGCHHDNFRCQWRKNTTWRPFCFSKRALCECDSWRACTVSASF